MFGNDGNGVVTGAILLAALAALAAIVLVRIGGEKAARAGVLAGVAAVLLCVVAAADQIIRDERNAYHVLEMRGDADEIKFVVEFEREPGGWAMMRARNDALGQANKAYGMRAGHHHQRVEGNRMTYVINDKIWND